MNGLSLRWLRRKSSLFMKSQLMMLLMLLLLMLLMLQSYTSELKLRCCCYCCWWCCCCWCFYWCCCWCLSCTYFNCTLILFIIRYIPQVYSHSIHCKMPPKQPSSYYVSYMWACSLIQKYSCWLYAEVYQNLKGSSVNIYIDCYFEGFGRIFDIVCFINISVMKVQEIQICNWNSNL